MYIHKPQKGGTGITLLYSNTLHISFLSHGLYASNIQGAKNSAARWAGGCTLHPGLRVRPVLRARKPFCQAVHAPHGPAVAIGAFVPGARGHFFDLNVRGPVKTTHTPIRGVPGAGMKAIIFRNGVPKCLYKPVA